jgi:hypothetical protein
MRFRDIILVIVAAVVIGLLAWLLLASGESDAPEQPGARAEVMRAYEDSSIRACGHTGIRA